MEAMPDRKDRKRKAPISYRPPKDLRAEFDARVEKSGLSTSAFITKAIFKMEPSPQSRRPALETKLLAKLLAQAAEIKQELHDVSTSGGEGNLLLLEKAADELTEIRAALLKAMGRTP